MKTARTRFVAWAAAMLVAASAFVACRTETPEEIVYTGQGTGGSGGSGATGGIGGFGAFAGAAGSAGTGALGGGLGGSPPDVPFSKQNLLVQIADCAVSHYTAFDGYASELVASTQAYAADRSQDNADQARSAWLTAMASWQEAELFRFGPMARPTSGDPGAQDFRDNIYSWNLVSRCKIEEQIVSQAYAAPDFGSSVANGRGLWAAEYLLFYGGTDNVCSKFSPINAQGSWSALTPSELGARKAAYAHAVAVDVKARAAGLVAAWDPAQGNFRRELLVGPGSSTYATEQQALNAVSDALFYIEMEVKDLKLGNPIGLNECQSSSCPDTVESPFAHRSVEHMRRNLLAARRLFEGCYADGAGLGFDDWLREVGQGGLADDMIQSLATARAALDALPSPLEQTVVTNPLPAQQAHAAVKQFTDMLKSDFVTVLNLDLPKTVQTDND